MFKQEVFDQIGEQVKAILKNNPLQDLDKNVKAITAAILAKLDLVTREEFDTQQKVLIATRQKLEELEQIVKKLSKK